MAAHNLSTRIAALPWAQPNTVTAVEVCEGTGIAIQSVVKLIASGNRALDQAEFECELPSTLMIRKSEDITSSSVYHYEVDDVNSTQPIAFMMVSIQGDKLVLIDVIHVDEMYRGMGVSAALLDRVITDFGNEYTIATAFVCDGTVDGARSLYTNRGFARDDSEYDAITIMVRHTLDHVDIMIS